MVLRSDTGKYAHSVCIDKARAGQAIDQPDIFDEDAQQAIPEKSDKPDVKWWQA